MGQWGVSAAASVSIDFGGIDASFWVVGFDIELLIGQSAQWSYKVQLVWHSCHLAGTCVLLVRVIWRFCRFGHCVCLVIQFVGTTPEAVNDAVILCSVL